ncbi:hypothetical protein MKW98_013959 [Papaver atlanticum]|uniref:CENP-V/GFA domain-containing protein n=1 Tax=Papaver atlanticum TaxID=357466 RepID=A0AAD4SIK3_9MAGN|nr:hypothetical protein MKW98_013959 [Papaver atlanticum]
MSKGGCHCGKVRWEAKGPSNVNATKCNCSNCSMRGNINFTIPSKNFKLLETSQDFITTYTFGTHTAKHTFCKVCGITSFYVPRFDPDGVALIVNCVDPGTLKHIEVKHVDGKNWEKIFGDGAHQEVKH